MAPPAKYEWLVPAPDLYYFRNTTVGAIRAQLDRNNIAYQDDALKYELYRLLINSPDPSAPGSNLILANMPGGHVPGLAPPPPGPGPIALVPLAAPRAGSERAAAGGASGAHPVVAGRVNKRRRHHSREKARREPPSSTSGSSPKSPGGGAPGPPPVSLPRIYAQAEGFADTTFNGAPARLRVHLTVYDDLATFQTRLVYSGDFFLVVPGEAERYIGFVHAFRLSKKTAAYPDASDEWVSDFVSVPLRDEAAVPREGVAMAFSLQAVFGEGGLPRDEVAAEFRHQLGPAGNDVLLVTDLQIFTRDTITQETYAGNGFGPTAMQVFYRLFWALPNWFAFPGPVTVILQPGELRDEQSQSFWDQQAPADETDDQRIERVTKTLVRMYTGERFGFTRIVYEAVVARYVIIILGREIRYQTPVEGDRMIPIAARAPRPRRAPPRQSTKTPPPDPAEAPPGDLERAGPRGKEPPPAALGPPAPSAFPSTEEELVAPLRRLEDFAAASAAGSFGPILTLTAHLTGGAGYHLFGRELRDPREDDDVYNAPEWWAAQVTYFPSARPADPAGELALPAADALVHALSHMSRARIADLRAVAEQMGPLVAAGVVRAAYLSGMGTTAILGFIDEGVTEEDDAAWRRVIDSVTLDWAAWLASGP